MSLEPSQSTEDFSFSFATTMFWGLGYFSVTWIFLWEVYQVREKELWDFFVCFYMNPKKLQETAISSDVQCGPDVNPSCQLSLGGPLGERSTGSRGHSSLVNFQGGNVKAGGTGVGMKLLFPTHTTKTN